MISKDIRPGDVVALDGAKDLQGVVRRVYDDRIEVVWDDGDRSVERFPGRGISASGEKR